MGQEVLILYGSETGNAESIAKLLGDKASGNGFDATVCSLDEAVNKKAKGTPQSLYRRDGEADGERRVVIICSTTGNGDAPRNAERFWRTVKKRSNPTDMFSHLAYTILGLGDTNYDKFCYMGVVMDKRLGELGAKRIDKLHCADEGTDLQGTVDPYCAELWGKLKAFASVDTQPVVAESGPEQVEIDSNTEEGKNDSTHETTTFHSDTSSAPVPPPVSEVSAKGAGSPPNPALVETLVTEFTPAPAQDSAKQNERVISPWSLPQALLGFEDVCELRTVSLLGAKTSRPAKADTCLADVRFVDPVDCASGHASPQSPLPPIQRSSNSSATDKLDSMSQVGRNATSPLTACITKSEYLTSKCSSSRVISMDLSLPPQSMPPVWQAGDAVGILCPNPDALVDELLQRLGLDDKAFEPVRALARARGPGGGSPSRSVA